MGSSSMAKNRDLANSYFLIDHFMRDIGNKANNKVLGLYTHMKEKLLNMECGKMENLIMS